MHCHIRLYTWITKALNPLVIARLHPAHLPFSLWCQLQFIQTCFSFSCPADSGTAALYSKQDEIFTMNCDMDGKSVSVWEVQQEDCAMSVSQQTFRARLFQETWRTRLRWRRRPGSSIRFWNSSIPWKVRDIHTTLCDLYLNRPLFNHDLKVVPNSHTVRCIHASHTNYLRQYGKVDPDIRYGAVKPNIVKWLLSADIPAVLSAMQGRSYSIGGRPLELTTNAQPIASPRLSR